MNKNSNHSHLVAIVLIVILLGVGTYYKLQDKKSDLPLTEIISESQKSILLAMKYDWQSIQGKIPFRPVHPGTTEWLEPNAVQFISTTSMIINFEDGYTSNLALLDIPIPEGEFQILETWKNKSLFTQEEWQEVVNKYGNSAYPIVSTYTVSLVRGTEIVSFPELTKVPENIFVKNYPLSSPKSSVSENENPTSGQEQNGEYIGYIKNISGTGGNYSLTIDYIQFLECNPGDYSDGNCPNGFKILNTNPKLRTFPISGEVVVRMATFSHQTSGVDKGNFNYGEIISFQTFKDLMDGILRAPAYLVAEEEFGSKPSPYVNHWPDTPFWVTLKEGMVVEIVQQYLP